ncbi:MAG: 4Fe-4S binding protein [Planctomycetes bacterium]|nr:4Fe-4S binding protein [Planctomycetota bacterium]
MARREIPEIDERQCTACGECVAVCPTECLAVWNALAVLGNVHACVSCGICERICGFGAIQMVAEYE